MNAADVGAIILGRKMFSGGSGPWDDDPNADGWWGDESPWPYPAFVLTHHARDPVDKGPGRTWNFVTGGIEEALERAREAAGEREVLIGGGADVARQYLNAGHVDTVAAPHRAGRAGRWDQAARRRRPGPEPHDRRRRPLTDRHAHPLRRRVGAEPRWFEACGRPPHNLCAVSDFPSNARIREVGPRDGFQNEPEVIATVDKVRLIAMLGAAGLRRIELTSFVRPDVIPQLADAEEVLRSVRAPRRGRLLGPDPERARARARARPCASASTRSTSSSPRRETHNRKNVNRSVAESLAGLERVIERSIAEGLRCEGVISTSFGCPYEGEVPVDRVLEIAERLAAAGCEEVAFGDTTGMANPRQVR